MKTEFDNLSPEDVQNIKIPKSYLMFRRIAEIFFILILSPFFLLLLVSVALFIILSGERKVFFIQQRPGLNDSKFKMIKFRTIKENYGSAQAYNYENQLIKGGKFLRKHHLDEIPQLINILLGKMSLIGPRPEADDYYEQCKKAIPLYKYRFRIKPGVTGWAQVNYVHTDNIEGAKEKLKYDLYYLQHISLMLDLKIILRTFSALVK